MKKIIAVMLFSFLLAIGAAGQGLQPNTQVQATTSQLDQVQQTLAAGAAKLTMPSYVGAGVSFDQTAPQRIKPFVFGAVPASKSVGIYLTITADTIPVKSLDATTKRTVYAIQPMYRAGAFKTLYTGSKIQIMAGLEEGASFGAAPTTGGTVLTLATSPTVNIVYQVTPHWGLVVPVRGVYSSALGGWNIVPEFGVVWKP